MQTKVQYKDMKHIKQDFSSKACVRPPGWTLGMGQRPKFKLFQNMVMLHIKFQGNDACSNMIANIFPVLTSGGSKGHNSTFSVHGHVVYQKGMTNAATCKHIFWPYPLPPPLGMGSKVKTFFFLKVVILHIKLIGMEHRALCKHIFCPDTHPGPLG